MDTPDKPVFPNDDVPGGPQSSEQEPFPFETNNLGFLDNPFANETPQVPGSPEEPQPPAENPEVDEKRYQFWQSRHDKVRRQLDEVQPFLPVLEALKSRPDILAQLAPGQSPQGLAAPQPPGLVEPTPPKKPRHYDATDALTNPESESFKYRLELEDYRDAKLDYLKARDEMRELAMQGAMEAARQEREMQAFISQRRLEAAQLGVIGEEQDRFLAWAMNPQVGMKDLVDLWSIREGKNVANPQAQPQQPPKARAAEVLEQRKRTIPSLAAASGGAPETPPQLDENQAMTAAFLAAGKRLQ